MGFIEKRNGRYPARYRDPLGHQRCQTMPPNSSATAEGEPPASRAVELRMNFPGDREAKLRAGLEAVAQFERERGAFTADEIAEAQGEPHVIWRRIGGHDIFKQP